MYVVMHSSKLIQACLQEILIDTDTTGASTLGDFIKLLPNDGKHIGALWKFNNERNAFAHNLEHNVLSNPVEFFANMRKILKWLRTQSVDTGEIEKLCNEVE